MDAQSLTQGFVSIPQSYKLVERLGEALTFWKQFCGRAVQEKRVFDYSGGVGYELKEFRGCTQDLKEDFHFTEAAYANMVSRIAHDDLREKGIFAQFLCASHHVLDSIVPTVYRMAANIEDVYDLPGFEGEVRDGQLTWTLRYLHYFGNRQYRETIAFPHVDKGGFTVHLYESNPGLEYLDYPSNDLHMKWRSMPIVPGQSIVIPGMQLQYRSGGKLKALCHRVVADDETVKHGRFSIVCFIPLVKSPRYNKAGKGRLQDMPPGFNYRIGREEFAELFV